MSARLTAFQSTQLCNQLSRLLGETDMQAPRQGEGEPRFTGRVLLPLVEQRLASTRIGGLAAHGDGGRIKPPPVPALGVAFRPDLAVRQYDDWFAAVEVKYLSVDSVQDQYAKAIGQCLVYGKVYQNCMLFAVDFRSDSQARREAVAAEAERLREFGVSLVCRRITGDQLEPAVIR